MTMGKSAAICMVRDAVDIVRFLCGHYLRIGVDLIHFVDDGSSDGTYELLQGIGARTGKVVVTRSLSRQDRQPERMSEAANSCIANGYRLVIPFDSDEFWNLRAADVAELAALGEPAVVRGDWVNFVQSRERHYPAPFGLYAMIHRAVPGVDVREGVIAYREPFISLSETKVAFWSDQPVRLVRGQHDLTEGGGRVLAGRFEILHAPLRWKSELTKRALNYEPRLDQDRPATNAWQSRFHREALDAGRLDEVWAANSTDRDGSLDVYGDRRRLARDNRFRNLLIKAAWFMYSRYRIKCF